jgi:hypothetical protein
MDLNGDGILQFDELATHYGFKMDMKGHRKGMEGMSDEQISEALQMQAALATMEEDQKEKRRHKEEEIKRAKQGNRRTSLGRLNTIETAAEVKQIKMPTRIILNQSDPEVLFLQAADLGDFSDLKKFLADGEVRLLLEDEKGEMAVHKVHSVDSSSRVVARPRYESRGVCLPRYAVLHAMSVCTRWRARASSRSCGRCSTRTARRRGG